MNGVFRANVYSFGPGGGKHTTVYSEIVQLLNTNDYIEIFGIPSATVSIQASVEFRTAFQAVYLSGTT